MSDPIVPASSLTDAQAVERAAKLVKDQCERTAGADCRAAKQNWIDAQDVVMRLATEGLQARQSRVAKINADLATVESGVLTLLAGEQGIIKASEAVRKLMTDIQSAFPGLSGSAGG